MYVAEDATYATGNQAIFKSSDFLGASVVDSTNTIFRFWPQDQTKYNSQDVDAPIVLDTFQLTHTEDAHIEVLKVVADAMANARGGFVVIQDDLGTAYTSDGASGGSARSDLKWGSIESTGTDIEVTAVTVSTI